MASPQLSHKESGHMERVWGGPKSPGMAAAFAACCITVKEPRIDRLETIKGRVRGPTKPPIRIAICLAVFPPPWTHPVMPVTLRDSHKPSGPSQIRSLKRRRFPFAAPDP